MAHLAKGQGQWAAGGALEREVLRINQTAYDFNIVRCKYAEMYRESGLADLGFRPVLRGAMPPCTRDSIRTSSSRALKPSCRVRSIAISGYLWSESLRGNWAENKMKDRINDQIAGLKGKLIQLRRDFHPTSRAGLGGDPHRRGGGESFEANGVGGENRRGLHRRSGPFTRQRPRAKP